MSRKATFRTLVIGFCLAIALFSSICVAETKKPVNSSVRFVVLGDRSGEPQDGVYEGIVAEVARLRPDFVITPGDLIVGYTADSTVLNQRWNEYLKIIKPLTMPFYVAPGNNDITFDAMLPMYERYIGQPYYSADYGDIHLIMLDNSHVEKVEDFDPAQLQWLEDDLKKSQGAKQTIALMHKPFWYNTVAEGKPDPVHALFVKYGVDAVFTGHFHDYFSGEYDGIKYTTVGSSGGGMRVGPTGIGYHFLWGTIDDAGIHLAVIDGESVRPWDDNTTEERQIWAPIRKQGVDFLSTLKVDPSASSEQGEIDLVLKNSMTNYPLSDTIRWETPDGWRIEPAELAVSIPAGKDSSFKFIGYRSGPVYPLPYASVKFNYAEGKSVEASTYLGVSRQVVGHSASTAPIIDGALTEKIWQTPVEYFFDPGGEPMKTDPFKFYFAYDRDNLYLAAWCKESVMDSIRADVTEHDGPIYSEDCVGYFIEPVYGTDTVYQIYINPRGAVFDGMYYRGDDGWMRFDREWNGEYETKTSRGDDFWSIEARIPLAQFGAAFESGQKTRLNFRRKQKRLESAANWQVPIDEDPKTMGTLLLK